MSDQQPHRTCSNAINVLPPLHGRPPPDLLVPIGVTYDSIITNPEETITIDNMLRLLRSISPKLDYVYELVEFNTYKDCREIKEMVLLMRSRAQDGAVSSSSKISGSIDAVEETLEQNYAECISLLQTIKGTLPTLRMTSQKTAEKLENHILANGEIDLLRLLFLHRDFIDTVFELFHQVDEFEEKTIQGFERIAGSRKDLTHKFETVLDEIDLLSSSDLFGNGGSDKTQQDHDITGISESEIGSITEYVGYMKEYL